MFRLSIAFGVIFTVGMIALLALVYLQTARELTVRSDQILRAQAAALLAVPADRLPAVIVSDNAGSPANLSYAALFAASGERVTGNLTRPSALRLGMPLDARETVTGRPIRLLAVPTDRGEIVVVGRNVGQIAALRLTIFDILLWTGGAIVVAGFIAGVALSLSPLRRVQTLAAAARQIGRGDFTVRMPLAGRRDELDMFARTVNEMVEQVERVVGQVKAVTDAVAHDLRTPLARLRARLHAISRDQAGSATDMLADLDLVLDRFTALLRISELEATTGAHFVPVDLARLLADVADLYGPLADERGQSLTLAVAGPATADADAKLLFEAIGNLVDNAIKFSSEGGAITLGLATTGGRSTISVCDSGPGIAADERSAVLRRFYRSQQASGSPGSGLGLSIVAAIAHRHHADLALDDAAPGLRVRFTLPAEHAVK